MRRLPRNPCGTHGDLGSLCSYMSHTGRTGARMWWQVGTVGHAGSQGGWDTAYFTLSVVRSSVTASRCLCSSRPLLNKGPEAHEQDAGDPDTPKRICKLLPCSDKVCVYRKIHRIRQIQSYPWLQAPTGGLGTCALWVRGTIAFGNMFFTGKIKVNKWVISVSYWTGLVSL